MKNVKVRNKIVILSSFQNCVNNKRFKLLFEALNFISDIYNMKINITLVDFHEHRTGPDQCLHYYMSQHKDCYNPNDRLIFEILDGNVDCHEDVCVLYNHLINSNDYEVILDLDFNELLEINMLHSMFLLDKNVNYVKFDMVDPVIDKMLNFLLVILSGGIK